MGGISLSPVFPRWSREIPQRLITSKYLNTVGTSLDTVQQDLASGSIMLECTSRILKEMGWKIQCVSPTHGDLMRRPLSTTVSVFEQWLISWRCLFDQDLSAVHERFKDLIGPWHGERRAPMTRLHFPDV